MVSHSGLLTVIERAARKVAPQLRRDFGEVQHLQVSRKGPADFVSLADKKAEDTLVAELQKARPDWGFLLEEGGEVPGDPNKPRWVIDPLDGTTNFLHGMPHFAISIAVQEPRADGKGWGEVTTGLIYQPMTDESYWAEKNRGAWRHDQRLRVSARRDMSEAVIATGIPFLGAWRFRAVEPDFRCACPVRGRHPPVRLGGARSRLGRGRALRRLLGKRAAALGRLGRHPAGARGRRLRHRFSRRGPSPSSGARSSRANDVLHSRLHKLLAGALR